eukprot:CAMPEP_0179123676 /NCGR_PEP_ID=MMETSP0796-20121207/58416_1 /TAXON_ID=73915 /ORGANISM="Pyrodinium bahamense, Strain pbaha01" /LENGTH=349 /DNA_ID=CAMNT_0020822321 /DNA_START=120 /DNA_END=1170 /DNA_ORIENTATION=+
MPASGEAFPGDPMETQCSVLLQQTAEARQDASGIEMSEDQEAETLAVHLMQLSAPPLKNSSVQASWKEYKKTQLDLLESRLAQASIALEAVQQSAGAQSVSAGKSVAEFIAMALFVFFGCGSAMSMANENGSAWVLQVSLTFGLAITVLAYSIGHISGGQINCAVTFGLVLHGDVSFWQGVCNFLAQMLGSVLGAAVLKVMYPVPKDLTGGLGTNSVADGWTQLGALIGEFMGTFLLMFVVLETAVNDASKGNSSLAPLAIGLSVFLAHSVLIPIDGCSINPTRTFGPALIQALSGGGGAAFTDMWVFWAGPLLGAAAATVVYSVMELASAAAVWLVGNRTGSAGRGGL